MSWPDTVYSGVLKPMPAADPKVILIEAGKAYVRANASAAGWFEGEIEGYVPGLVDAMLSALAAHKLEIK